MNILFTSDLSGLGGGETSLLNMCEYLKNDDINIFAMCSQKGKLVDALKQVNVHTKVYDYRNKKKILSSIVTIRKYVKKNRINVIHSNDPLTSILFYFSTLGLNRRNYWTCHGQWYDFSKIIRILLKISNRKIFCVSTSVEKSLNKQAINKTIVSYLGIPINKYRYAEKSDIRQQFGISEKALLIACIGRFQKIKGQIKIVKAVEKLKNIGVDIKCLLVGGCIFNNSEEKKYFDLVNRYVNENGLSDRVFFLGERRDIPNILKGIDFLVVPSDNESFGMVAIESLATGTVVVSTPNDGVSEILCYDSRFISKENSVDGLYDVLLNAIKNEIWNNEEVKKFVLNRSNDFSISEVTKKYLDIFMEQS